MFILSCVVAFAMSTDTVYVGVHFNAAEQLSPQAQIEKVKNVARSQAVRIVEHDSISIFEEDGTSFHALQWLEGEIDAPLTYFHTRSTDVCIVIERADDIEAQLRELDERDDLFGPAYLRTTFNVEKQLVQYFACRAVRDSNVEGS